MILHFGGLRNRILRPILCCPDPNAYPQSFPLYQIIAGERRCGARHGCSYSLTQVPVVAAKDVTPRQMLEMARLRKIFQRADWINQRTLTSRH